MVALLTHELPTPTPGENDTQVNEDQLCRSSSVTTRVLRPRKVLNQNQVLTSGVSRIIEKSRGKTQIQAASARKSSRIQALTLKAGLKERRQSIREILIKRNVDKPKRAADILLESIQNIERNSKMQKAGGNQGHSRSQEVSISKNISKAKSKVKQVSNEWSMRSNAPSPGYIVSNATIEGLVIRVVDYKRKDRSKLVKISLMDGIIVDDDEATFKCEEM